MSALPGIKSPFYFKAPQHHSCFLLCMISKDASRFFGAHVRDTIFSSWLLNTYNTCIRLGSIYWDDGGIDLTLAVLKIICSKNIMQTADVGIRSLKLVLDL